MNHGDDELKTLFRAALSEEHPSDADRRAVRSALSTALGVGIGATASGVSASTLGGASAMGKAIGTMLFGGKFIGGLLVGAALGTAVTATVYVVDRIRVAPQVAAARTPVTGVVTPAIPIAAVASAQPSDVETPAVEAQPVVERRVVEVREPSGAQLQRPVDSAPLPTPNTDALLVETMALAKVQAALDEGDSTTALRLLKAQDRTFSTGQLAEERAAAWVLALCAAGHQEEADQSRARFIAVYPNSPLTKRIKKGCER